MRWACCLSTAAGEPWSAHRRVLISIGRRRGAGPIFMSVAEVWLVKTCQDISTQSSSG